MSLIFNGTEIETILYNGVQLDKVIYNGVTIYESYDFNNSYFYVTNTTASDLDFNIRFKCDDTPLYIYYYYKGAPRGNYKAEVVSTGNKTLTLRATSNSTLIIEFVGGKFSYYDSIGTSTLLYDEPQLLTKAIIGKNCSDSYSLLDDSTELTEIIFAAEGTPFNMNRAPKLSKLTFKYNPSYIGNIYATALETFVTPANISEISGVKSNPNLKSLTILPNNIQMGQSKCVFNESLEHLYTYVITESTRKSTQLRYSWVRGCNPNLVIHLSQSIGNIEQAKILFGDYFNYISETEQATVVFDL